MDNFKDKFESTFKYPFENIDKTDCIICQDNKYIRYIKLACGHYFHKNCFDKHVKARKTNCSVCRKEIDIIFNQQHPFKYILFTQDHNPNRFILVNRKKVWQLYHYMNDRLISKLSFFRTGVIAWIDCTIQNNFDVSLVIEYVGNRNLVFRWVEVDEDILTSFENMVSIELFDDILELN